MNIEDILTLGDYDKVIQTIIADNNPDIDDGVVKKVENISAVDAQYNYDGGHSILDRSDRTKADGGLVTLAKMVLNYPKKIVENAVAFLFGVPVDLSKKTEGGDEAYLYLKDALKGFKFDQQNRELARKLFVQKRAAKLYFIKNPQDPLTRKISSLVLSVENGYFYPNFSDTGDMDAFLRTYEKKVLEGTEIKKAQVFELYTVEKIVTGTKTSGSWVTDEQANLFQKIPVVYYEQEKTEWQDVQTLIDRQELSLSELIDTNQYFGSPTAVGYGNIENLPNKEDGGKFIQCNYVQNPQNGNLEKSDIKYLTWDQRPESLNLQFELLEKYIYSFSQTADISFLNMIKNQPGNISGTALQFLLLDPILKSYNKQELFGENLQRELSVVKAILSTMETKYANDFDTMDIEITFGSILPNNMAEVINYLSAASGGNPIISTETAVQKNPLITDKEAEIARLQGNAANQNGSFNLNM